MRKIVCTILLCLLCAWSVPCLAGQPVSEYAEAESLGGGLHRMTIHSVPIAYQDAGKWKRIDTTWVDSGNGTRPHAITQSRLMTTVSDDGMRRIHPTRELGKYIEIGAPYVKPAASWMKVAFSGAQRSDNKITWSRAEADLSIVHAGHYIKLDIELKGGYVPPNRQFAFPVGIQGLTRSGNQILDGGTVVMTFRAPVAYDAANTIDVRPIDSQFVQFPAGSGNWYILFALPDLTGMSRPVVDPTVTLQPDGATGVDTYITNQAPVTNLGTEAYLYVGGPTYTKRGLIKFDLSTLPDAAIIDSASLSLEIAGDSASVAINFFIYRFLVAWIETQATWNNRITGTAWTTAGGFSATDCEQSPIGSVTVPGTAAVGSRITIPITVATKAGLDLGNGWMIKTSGEPTDGYVLWSSDGAGASDRPELVINYHLLNSVISF